jgi:DNA-binding MarR family transcriptional regulator
MIFEFVYYRQKRAALANEARTMAEFGAQAEIDDALRRAAATQRLAMERALAGVKLTPAQYAVLRIIAETPGLSNADVARIERLTPQTTSLIIANLERKDAVARRAHETHGRIRRVQATEAGLRLLHECRERLRGPYRRLAVATPPGGERLIEAWLNRLADAEV